jgi:hypothetical protein
MKDFCLKAFLVNLNRKNSSARLRLRLRLASGKKFNRLRLRLSNRLRNRSYNLLIIPGDHAIKIVIENLLEFKLKNKKPSFCIRLFE